MDYRIYFDVKQDTPDDNPTLVPVLVDADAPAINLNEAFSGLDALEQALIFERGAIMAMAVELKGGFEAMVNQLEEKAEADKAKGIGDGKEPEADAIAKAESIGAAKQAQERADYVKEQYAKKLARGEK